MNRQAVTGPERLKCSASTCALSSERFAIRSEVGFTLDTQKTVHADLGLAAKAIGAWGGSGVSIPGSFRLELTNHGPDSIPAKVMQYLHIDSRIFTQYAGIVDCVTSLAKHGLMAKGKKLLLEPVCASLPGNHLPEGERISKALNRIYVEQM